MAKIVCIGEGWVRPNCAEDDVTAIHDDDVALTGTGYALARIYKVENVTAAEVQAKFASMMPEQKPAFKSKVAGEFTHEQPEEIRTWKNSSGKWCELKEEPKYKITLASLATEDKENLASKLVIGVQTLVILGKCSEKIHLNEVNNSEIAELNEAIK